MDRNKVLNDRKKKGRIRFSVRTKILMLAAIVVLPFLFAIFYLLASMSNYSRVYERIVSDITVANNYNLNFKEEMDESMYKLVVGYVTFDNISEEDTLENPYDLIEELRGEFTNLMDVTAEGESRVWLQSLLNNLDTLENRIDDIVASTSSDGQYDDNIERLDNNIYVLTELIQDDIQYYIYYQTQNMEEVTDDLNTQIRDFIIFFVGIMAVLILIITIAAVLIASGIIKPVRELYGATQKIARGDFTARARINTTDEIAELAEGFNTMAGNMQGMIQKIKEDEQKMRRADLRLLQEQINPHFLYNTLDTIVWLIEGNETDQAVNMVVTLSGFFRQVLNKGKELITIKEEEQHIRSYLEIQSMRYHDILEYDIQIDQVLYDYQILKLTLQPVVENALYHGIKYKRAKGYIHVNGEMDGNLIRLTVRDNGAGMEEKELEELREEIGRPCKETEKGFGLANVNERIHMYFGEQYGITIQSVKDRGTIVEITIPAIKPASGKEEGDARLLQGSAQGE
ncbi:MAG TPA: histidine kinase [Candidatus Mediterraneibacter gallistercoris]|uniref:histidine kinase n=1 Tax=Candidatus Mediterraneibacter gallistercoris TaxID=2838671 RepID=A0A9D2P2N4_9FIRM|nr:histidine kinase [Candidatus Mediterraneibacter gallistercoris]